ncbi:aldehyde dehydrogenase family protein [Pseudarcicella hirudinis]|uniref:aldehyde dehydrogenase family protein n=1 Tax=Pseudarcicella hirudinis TaxID=1079859 RepID=UPI0035ED485D
MSDTISAIPEIMSNARLAFEKYSRVSAGKRAVFLETIAEEIENKREALVNLANLETNLPLPRLNGEIGRTTGQLKMFANLIKEGSWVEAVIDLPDAERVPAKPDTRKMLVPLGPVIVFGASNFPFAFNGGRRYSQCAGFRFNGGNKGTSCSCKNF